MTFLGRFIRNFSWTASGSLVSNLVAFFTTFTILASLSVFDYGLLILALSVQSILSSFMGFGLEKVVSSDIAHEIGRGRKDRAKSLFLAFTKINLAMGIAIAAGLFIFAPQISAYLGRPEVSDLLKIVGIMVLLGGIKAIVNVLFQSAMRFKYLSIRDVSEAIARLTIILSFASLGVLDITFAFLSYPLAILASLAVSGVFIKRCYSIYRGVKSSKEKLFRKMVFGHGKFVIIQRPFTTIADNSSVWIIEYAIGVQAVGLFALARKV